MRRASFAVVAGLLVVGAAAGAQEVRDRRVGLTLSAGPAGVPDALGAQCGRNGGSGAGVTSGAGLVVRPWRWIALQADAQWIRDFANGCHLVLYSVDTSYEASGYRQPFTASTFRVGVETPPGMPLVRATAGIGRAWGAPTIPLTVFGVAVGSRGRRLRFLVEAERLQARVRAEEVHNDPGEPATRRPIVLHPVSQSVRIGLEIPLVR